MFKKKAKKKNGISFFVSLRMQGIVSCTNCYVFLITKLLKNIMKELFTNETLGHWALIITAIISFIGVSIGAILNYRSNIKTNKARIKSEERSARLPYQKKIFDVLKDALNTLDENESKIKLSEGKKSLGDAREKVFDACIASLKIYNAIMPYLTKTNSEQLAVLYKIINDEKADIQIKYLSGENYTDLNKYIENIKKMIEFKSLLRKVISEELSNIVDEMRINKEDEKK